MVYLVVRIRGLVNIPYWREKTLDNLNLRRKFSATIIKENAQTLGMLRKVKDLVAWKSVDESIIKELLEIRGRVKGLRGLTRENLPSDFKTIDDLAVSIIQNNRSLSEVGEIKPWFTLSPPKGGFKRKTKTQYSQNGILGENNELTELVKRMI